MYIIVRVTVILWEGPAELDELDMIFSFFLLSSFYHCVLQIWLS